MSIIIVVTVFELSDAVEKNMNGGLKNEKTDI